MRMPAILADSIDEREIVRVELEIEGSEVEPHVLELRSAGERQHAGLLASPRLPSGLQEK